MDGSEKITPLIIGKSAKPRCFKGINSFPTNYRSNKKACCFKKSDFPSPNLVDVEDTLTEFNAEPSLWEALPEQDLTFDDYVLVDTDSAVWGAALSDVEIVVLNHNNTESDEDESEELTPLTLSEAKKCH
ncbi:uncharacterized protein TNCV_3732641 [Trichonephila clavipes]|nr:uncharacterized protein TNCV_3732641 [Trichonephila clavipes]